METGKDERDVREVGQLSGSRPHQRGIPQVPVVHTADDLLADERFAFGELKLDIFFWMDVLPQFGHSISVHDSLKLSNSSKDCSHV
jgi:hypothetical protein